VTTSTANWVWSSRVASTSSDISPPLEPLEMEKLDSSSFPITAPPSVRQKSNITQCYPRLALSSTPATTFLWEQLAENITAAPLWPSSMLEIRTFSLSDLSILMRKPIKEGIDWLPFINYYSLKSLAWLSLKLALLFL